MTKILMGRTEMSIKDLPDWNIFRKLYNRPEDVVLCVDLLMTRRRIGDCADARELRKLAKELRSATEQVFNEVKGMSKRTMFGIHRFGEIEHDVDFSGAISKFLIQDTIVVIYDI